MLHQFQLCPPFDNETSAAPTTRRCHPSHSFQPSLAALQLSAMSRQQRHLWHVPEECLSPEVAGELDAGAARHWNTFYKQNKINFFKDRHYLDREFPELASGNCTILEVGCGVGNTAFPLLELSPQSQVYACDFASSAIELVKAHPQYACGRMHAFVADITCDDLRANVLPSSVDICTMVFVLSAITPAKMPLVSISCFQFSFSHLFSLLYCS